MAALMLVCATSSCTVYRCNDRPAHYHHDNGKHKGHHKKDKHHKGKRKHNHDRYHDHVSQYQIPEGYTAVPVP